MCSSDVAEPETSARGGSSPASAISAAASSTPTLTSQLFSGNANLTDEEKMNLIQSRKPEATYQYPSITVVDSRRKNGTSQRKFNKDLLEEFTWMSFCKASNGVGCLCCILFPTEGKFSSAPTEVFVTRAHTGFKKLKRDAKVHEMTSAHQDGETKMNHFVG